jgi:hypothetical protein
MYINGRLWKVLHLALRNRKALTECAGNDMGRVVIQLIDCCYENFKLNLYTIEFFENQRIILRFLIIILYIRDRNFQDIHIYLNRNRHISSVIIYKIRILYPFNVLYLPCGLVRLTRDQTC